MNQKPLLTIAIPNYNGGENLKRALYSIKYIKLPLDEFEILLVDNHSTDNSIDIIYSFREIFPNIRLFQNRTNIGRVENWNRCLELANGKYLLFLFTNDELHSKNEIHKAIDILEKIPKVSLVFGDIFYMYGKKKMIAPNYTIEFYGELKDYVKKTFLDLKNFGSFLVLQQQIIRTEIIKKHQIRFISKYPRTTDRVFTFNVISNGTGCFYYIPNTFTIWHLTPYRFHFQVHENPFVDPDLLWMNELWANRYILQRSGFDEKIIFLNFINYFILLLLNYLIKFKIHNLKHWFWGCKYLAKIYTKIPSLTRSDYFWLIRNFYITLIRRIELKIFRKRLYKKLFT